MDIRLPNLGEDAEGGAVASIFVKEGDMVEKDQALIELESEKAVASIPSTAAGKVTRVHVTEGQEIRVGAVIVSLEAAGGQAEASPPAPAPAKTPAPAEPAAPRAAAAAAAPSPLPPPAEAPRTPDGIPPPASPAIRRLARDLGIDLLRVRGSEPGGRVVMEDLRNYIAQLQQTAAAAAGTRTPAAPDTAAIDFSRWGPVEALPASSLRKTIAARMAQSWSTIPHVTQFIDADITALDALRRAHQEAYKKKDARLTLTPIILKAVVKALAKHPIINSSLDEGASTIVMKQYYHLGLAVDTEAGLIVPVIRDVDKKSVLELAREIEDLVERTRQRKVGKDEMLGGTFTVSNQGGIGGAHFTPIINKPESAILGVGRGRELPRFREGKLEARQLLPLALSHDHRVIDGADAVRFLVDFVAALENFPEAELKLGSR